MYGPLATAKPILKWSERRNEALSGIGKPDAFGAGLSHHKNSPVRSNVAPPYGLVKIFIPGGRKGRSLKPRTGSGGVSTERTFDRECW